MSTTVRWRIALASLTAVCGIGLILTVLLALGLADPPHIGALQWQANSPVEMSDPMSLPAAYTLELAARNDGPAESAWGMHLASAEQSITILIDNQSYMSISADDEPHWAEFPHIRPFGDNHLYLHVEPGGAAILRINHEIAWEGTIDALSWAVVEHHQPTLVWDRLALYHE